LGVPMPCQVGKVGIVGDVAGLREAIHAT
jgi:hypothetical protein